MKNARILAAVLAAACAPRSLPPPPEEPGPEPGFRGVTRVALVRWVDPGEPARRDPLDALGSGLAAEGVGARAVEVGPGAAGEDAGLRRIAETVRSRVESSGPLGGARRRGRLDGVDPVLDRLRVDALAFSVRTEGPPAPVPFGLPRGPIDAPRDALSPGGLRRGGAIALAGRGGALVWFEWWPDAGPRDRVAATPAEAVDQALGALVGDGDGG